MTIYPTPPHQTGFKPRNTFKKKYHEHLQLTCWCTDKEKISLRHILLYILLRTIPLISRAAGIDFSREKKQRLKLHAKTLAYSYIPIVAQYDRTILGNELNISCMLPCVYCCFFSPNLSSREAFLCINLTVLKVVELKAAK